VADQSAISPSLGGPSKWARHEIPFVTNVFTLFLPVQYNIHGDPTATHGTTLQHAATHCNTLTLSPYTAALLFQPAPDFICHKRAATFCITQQQKATLCHTQQHTATHDNTRQRTLSLYSAVLLFTQARILVHHKQTATICNTLQHTATHCNTPQHATTCSLSRRILQHSSSSHPEI